MSEKIYKPRRLFIKNAAASTLPFLVGNSVFAQSIQKKPVIFMITYRGKTAVEDGFETYLKANNFDATIIHRDIGRDTEKLAKFRQEIKEVKPDLVYTWGTSVTLGTLGRFDASDQEKNEYIQNIPSVFVMVTDPVASGVLPDLKQKNRPVTGTIHVVPLLKQMEAMKRYRDFSSVGVLYNKKARNSNDVVNQLYTLGKQMGFRVIERTFDVDSDGKPTNENLDQKLWFISEAGADWLYLLPDTFLGKVYDEVAPISRSLGLPSFGAAELAVTNGGAVFGLISSYFSVGELAAKKAIQILRDQVDPATIPAETLKRFSLMINMDVAGELQFFPPVELLNYASIYDKK